MVTAAGAEQVVLVRIAGERFAIDAALVEEVVDGVAPRALPGLPAHSPGVLEHRGAWLPAIDPAPLLDLPRRGPTPASALIVKRGPVRFALAVDAVLRVAERPRAVAVGAEPEAGEGAAAEAASLLEDEEGVISVLRPDSLFRGDLPEEARESRMSTEQLAAPIPIVAFRLGTDEFGVEVQQVQEVIAFQRARPVPHAPEFVEGVIDVRGTVVPVVDLRKRFGLPAPPPDADTRVLLTPLGHEQIGLVVDAVTEVTRVPPADISEPPAFFRGLAARYLAGLARARGGLLILLRLDRILTSEERLALLGAEPEEAAGTPAKARAGKGKRVRRRAEE